MDAGGLNNVRVERALDQPGDFLARGALGFEDLPGLIVKDGDELTTDALALLFGVRDANELGKEALAGVDRDDLKAETFAHGLLHGFELAFAKDAVVDEDAGEAIADGALDEDSGNGGVDAAGKAAEGVAGGTDLLTDAVDGGLDEVGGGPVLRGAAEVDNEVAEEFSSLARVGDLGVELDGPHAVLRVLDGGHGVAGAGDDLEAGCERFGVVAVAHPDLEGGGEALEEGALGGGMDLGVAVLAGGCGDDAATEVMGHELQAVADAEQRNAGLEDGWVGLGGGAVIDRAWAAGEDDALGLEGEDVAERRGAGEDDGEDVELADATGDELGVLRAEVEDDDGGRLDGGLEFWLGKVHGSSLLGW